MKKLTNKIVFITGANTGIGKAASLEAAREGATVVVADMPGISKEQTIRELKALGADCLFVPLDLADKNSVEKAIRTTVKKFGRLDIAFNNTGMGGVYSQLHRLPEAYKSQIISANIVGQYYCVKYELQQFIKQGGGIFVNMSSLGTQKNSQEILPFAISQKCLPENTSHFENQYGSNNIRANIICPYYISTAPLHVFPDAAQDPNIKSMPLKQLCKPEEIAKAFIYLASGDSRLCQGKQIILN